MYKTVLTAGAMLGLASPAFALSALPAPERTPIIEQVRADCAWVDNKWTYKKGDKMLVCRPDRPRGAGWIWHREGGREGWYHKTRREFFHKNWLRRLPCRESPAPRAGLFRMWS